LSTFSVIADIIKAVCKAQLLVHIFMERDYQISLHLYKLFEEKHCVDHSSQTRRSSGLRVAQAFSRAASRLGNANKPKTTSHHLCLSPPSLPYSFHDAERGSHHLSLPIRVLTPSLSHTLLSLQTGLLKRMQDLDLICMERRIGDGAQSFAISPDGVLQMLKLF